MQKLGHFPVDFQYAFARIGGIRERRDHGAGLFHIGGRGREDAVAYLDLRGVDQRLAVHAPFHPPCALRSKADLVAYCDRRTRLSAFKDAPGAFNGLQVSNDGRVTRIGAAVDAGIVPFRNAVAAAWFRTLRDRIVAAFEGLEDTYAKGKPGRSGAAP